MGFKSEILAYSDQSFRGNDDGSYQVGFMIFLTDKYNTTSLFDYSSIKSRRLVQSVLGAETFGIKVECDASIVPKHNIKGVTGNDLNIKILSDNEAFLNVIIRN